MTQQQLQTVTFKTQFFRKRSQELAVLSTRILQRVVVANLREVVVVWIGVAALAVVQLVADAVVVVALNADDVVFVNQREHTVRMRTERTKVAETVDLIGSPALRTSDRCFQREVVVIDSAEECQSHVLIPTRVASRRLHSCRSLHTDSTCNTRRAKVRSRRQLPPVCRQAWRRAIR